MENSNSILRGPKEPLPDCVHLANYFEQLLLNSSSSSSPTASRVALLQQTNDDTAAVRQLTFKEFHTQYKALSRALRQHVVPAAAASAEEEKCENATTPIVGVAFQEPCIELALAVFGILDANFAFLPLDLSQPGERLDGIIKSANVACVLTDNYAAVHEKFANYTKDKIKEYDWHLQWSNPNYHKHKPDSIDVPVYDVNQLLESGVGVGVDTNTNSSKEKMTNELAAILFTSGSTGIPKGVPIRHASFMNMMDFRRRNMPFGPEEMGLMKSAFTFIDGIIELFEALLQLRTLLIIPKSVAVAPDKLLGTLARYSQIRRMALVPSHMSTIVEYLLQQQKSINNENIECVILDGEELTYKLVEQIFQCFPRAVVYNIYGTTETCGDNTYECISSAEHLAQLARGVTERTLPVGEVCQNLTLYLVDEDTLQPTVPANKIGKIFFSGVGVARQYIGMDTGRFTPNNLLSDVGENDKVLYETGDLGFIDADTRMLYLQGRSDDLAKIRGQRIHLSELNAAAVAAVDGGGVAVVVECASVMDKAYTTQRLLTFYRCRTQEETQSEEIKQRIQKSMESRLPSYAVPILVPYPKAASLPRLSNGKIDKKSLLHYYHEEVAKLDPTDTSLLGIISNVLGLPKNQLDLSLSFGENGGNSLNTVITVTEINKHGYNIFLADFLETPTLQQLLTKYDNKKTPNDNDIKSKKTLLHATLPDEYEFVELSDIDPMEGANFISKGNIEFGELEQYMKDIIDQKHIAQCIAGVWPQFIEHDLSLGIRRRVASKREEPHEKKGELVALIMALDENKPLDFQSLTGPYFDTIEELLGNPEADLIVRNLSAVPDEMLAGFSLNVHRELNEAEKIKLFYLLQVEEIRRAKAKGYKYIVGGDTSPVTQGVGKLLGYKTQQTIRINQLTRRDGSRPFITAPDDHVTTLDVLTLDDVEIN